MNSADEIRNTAIKVMTDKGVQFCEENIHRWWRGEFLKDKKQIQENMRRWNSIKHEISRLAAQMKG